eukprot:Rmarinus@m.17626
MILCCFRIWFSFACSLLSEIRSTIYDAFIVSMTSKWYSSVIERLEDGSDLLDVGIGTGSALVHNEFFTLSKRIHVHGVDYDPDYVRRCRRLFARHGLQECFSVDCISFYDYDGPKYDAVYFSGSLMIMPNPTGALRHAARLLKEGGRIFITQTFEKEPNPILDFVKPLLKYVTTIDFGHVTYEKDLFQSVEEAGLLVKENCVISGQSTVSSSFSSGWGTGRSFRLVCLEKPRTR